MKILFATDLHGHPARYDALEKVAADFRPAIVINGGDMLPHGSDMTGVQRRFVEGRLDEHFLFFDTAGMDYLFMPGNDDLASLDGLLSKVAGRYRRIHPIAQRHIEIGGYSFIGMNLVTDYPFRLKDRCRMDMRRFEFPAQRGGACFSSGKGWREMSTEEWFVTARSLPTIEDELERLRRPESLDAAVYVIHMPPAGVGLDVCLDGRAVGSQAIARFVKSRQPLLTLHGHIHESPEVTGIWNTSIGESVCIQPGQSLSATAGLICVTGDLRKMAYERFTAQV